MYCQGLIWGGRVSTRFGLDVVYFRSCNMLFGSNLGSTLGKLQAFYQICDEHHLEDDTEASLTQKLVWKGRCVCCYCTISASTPTVADDLLSMTCILGVLQSDVVGLAIQFLLISRYT